MNAAHLLKEARQRAGLSQSELGRRAGCSGTEVSRWERGTVPLRFDRLEDLVEGCGLELDIALRPLDRSRDALIGGNLGRPPTGRIEGMERHLRRASEIQGGEDSFEPLPILETLAEVGLDFVVIGAVAAALRGSPFPTGNLDVMVREGARNRRRLERAMEAIGARGGEATDGVERFATPHGEVRVVAAPASMPTYVTLRRRADAMTVGRAGVMVAPLADVIRSAEARPVPGRRAEVLTLRRIAAEVA